MFLSSKRVEFYLKSKYPFHRSHLHSDPLFVLEKKKPSLCCASQELTWSHTHASSSVSRSSESVWPELLLQANIEQVRKANRQMFFAGPGTRQDSQLFSLLAV